ncbi:MAG: hypothetical protein HGJ94_03835 [Desulfosarcina sp.]|nr:hypothetical protein [Desulfosarcina sp.]MBC2717984.1 hypothetical protein [Desulfobacteraceae bacterium]MBC2758222.1 hypothetical protein [Desulfobacteraceae bacterium]
MEIELDGTVKLLNNTHQTIKVFNELILWQAQDERLISIHIQVDPTMPL